MEQFDTETFIIAIQNRPVIWDSRLPEYCNKNAKRKAWDEINEMFDLEFAYKSSKEKNASAVELQRKWKNLKDCYNRERQRLKNCPSGSGAKPKKQYVYYKLLSFLQPLTEIRPPKQPTDSEEYDTEDCVESFVIPTSKKPKRSGDVDDAQNKLYEVLTEKLNKITPTSHQHPDQHFLLSLFPHFNSIKEEYKLEVKAEMINLLRKYNNITETPAYSSDYGNGHQSGYQSYNTFRYQSYNTSRPGGTRTESSLAQQTPPMPAGASTNAAGSSSQQNNNEYNSGTTTGRSMSQLINTNQVSPMSADANANIAGLSQQNDNEYNFNDDSTQDSDIIADLYSP